MKTHPSRLIVLLSSVLFLFWFLYGISPNDLMRYTTFELWIFLLIPPIIYLIYFIPVIDTWKKVLVYSILIPFFCLFPIEIFYVIARREYRLLHSLEDYGILYNPFYGTAIPISLLLGVLLVLLSSHKVLIVKLKINTWKRCLAYGIIPSLCIGLMEFLKRGYYNPSKFIFFLYSLPLILFFAIDSSHKKDRQNETSQELSLQTTWIQHAQLLGLNISNTKKFILAVIVSYIVFALIHCFMLKAPKELFSICGFFVLSLGTLLLLFPAVALRPIRAILICALLPLLWSVLFCGIYAVSVISARHIGPYHFSLEYYQPLLSQISTPDFYVTPYLELGRWYASFPLLTIWAAYYWLKKTELRREAI